MANNDTTKAATTPAPDATAAAILELAKSLTETARQQAEVSKQQTEALIAAQPFRRLSVDECKQSTPFNPKGTRNRRFVVVDEVYQNGGPLSNLVAVVHDEEIRLIGRLAELTMQERTAGRYIEDRVVVEVKMHDGKRDLHISYKNAKVEDRLAAPWRSLTDLLKMCVAEAEAKAALNAN